jgi:superfamily II DNA/RNA helicase
VVLPTRELAIQVNQEYKMLKQDEEWRNIAVYGGSEMRPQIQDIRNGIDILVGTPGRLLDLMDRGIIQLSDLKTIVLDEADLMLDMGF